MTPTRLTSGEFRMRFFSALSVALFMLVGTSLELRAGTITFGGPNATLDSDSWSFDGSQLSGWSSAILNPANFGPGGVVGHSINKQSMGTINAATLANVDVFVSPYWSDSASSPFVTDIVNYFLSGGNLFLLQDASSFDAIGDALGIATVGTQNGNPHTGTGALFNNVFGNPASISQAGTQGYLSESAVNAHNGTIGARNRFGRVTAAYWNPGEYAAGAGAMVILADVDMISNSTSNYTTMNNNAQFALNSTAFLASSAQVPEPTSALVWAALTGLCAMRFRRS